MYKVRFDMFKNIYRVMNDILFLVVQKMVLKGRSKNGLKRPFKKWS